MFKFKVGDRILNTLLPNSPAHIVSINEEKFYVRYSDDPLRMILPYFYLDVDFFILDQAYYNEQEMRKLLGVTSED